MTDRLLIIGWDGADWEILENLVERGSLPNVKAMLDEDAHGVLNSTIPSHSWAAWSTFLTGRNPGGHGVFDFVERHPTEIGKRIPVSSTSIKAPSWPEILSQAGAEVRVGNVPVTFPPLEVKGRFIAGVVIPPGANFVTPREWSVELERAAPFPVNGMEWSSYKNKPEALIQEARRFIEQRTASFELMLEGEWSVATCVYVATDRLQHAFGAYLMPSHPDYSKLADSALGESVRELYRLLDAHIERLRHKAGDAATTVLISDHGFRPVARVANLNKVLEQLGFASRAASADTVSSLRRSRLVRNVSATRIGRSVKKHVRRPASVDYSKTIAYQSAAGGGVSLNLKGREPQGIVEPSDYDRVLEEIRGGLLGFADPETGQRVIEDVPSKEELYSGPYVDLAPDMILQPAPLWTFSHRDQITDASEWPTGAHRQAGIIAAAGGRTVPGKLGERAIADVPATVLAFSGVPAPELDGSAILEISGRPVTFAGGKTKERTAVSPELSDEDQEHIAQHLRDLGYIE